MTTTVTPSDAEATTTTEPTTTVREVDEPVFDIPVPPPDLRACSPLVDLLTWPTYVDGGPDVSMDAVFVINVSDSTCGLDDPGFTIGDDAVPVGSSPSYDPGSSVLGRGERAVFLVMSPRPKGAARFDTEGIDSVNFGLNGDYRADNSLSKYIEGVSFVGPVDWTGPPHGPTVFIPSDPDAGTPIGQGDLVTTVGLGSFRAGMSPQALADATRTTFVVSEWGAASEGCGYGQLPPDLRFTISSPTNSLDDASVGAIVSAGGRRTPSGLGIGTSVEELRSVLGDDRLTTRVNEYSGADDYLFTPRSPDEQHLGMFFRIDPETLTVSSYEAGLQTQIGRGEGCA